jgi:multiple sugar transport system permease protein
VFTQALIMTDGGPLNSTRFYMLYLYDNAFGFLPPQMGYASALAWILFVLIFACSLVLVRTSNRWVFYGN